MNYSKVANTYNNLGISYGKANDFDKGLLFLEKALEIYKGIFGDNIP